MKKEMYNRNAIRKKRLKKLRTNSWFLPHGNAPEHQMVLVKGFLAKNNMATLEHPTHTPGLAPNNFYLFPQSEGTVLL